MIMKTDTVVRVLSVLRALTEEGVLVGRSRSALLGPVGVFGTGILVGVGVGMLVTPMTGKDARAYARGIVEDLKTKLESVQEQIAELGEGSETEGNGADAKASKSAAASASRRART
jgi:gas vesicle protein